MTMTRSEIQITWAAATSKSVSNGSADTSDEFAFATGAIQASISCKADNDGTPASGDEVEFFLLLTCGDPDGAGADEYDSVNHGLFVGLADTNTDDPAQFTVSIPASAKGGKLRAVNKSAGRAITVSACINEVVA